MRFIALFLLVLTKALACQAQDGKPLPFVTINGKDTLTEVMAYAPFDMDAYLRENIRYPEQALKNQIGGIVFVQFLVTEQGRIDSATVYRGPGYGCNAEALRAIKAMPDWVPATRNGQPVRMRISYPVRFILNRN